MTLGYSMKFCSVCERETNHRMAEQNGKLKKECVICGHATLPQPPLHAAKAPVSAVSAHP